MKKSQVSFMEKLHNVNEIFTKMKCIRSSCLQNFKKNKKNKIKKLHKLSKEFLLKDDPWTLFYWDLKGLTSCFTSSPVIWKAHFQEEYLFSQYPFFRMFLVSIESVNVTRIFEGKKWWVTEAIRYTIDTIHKVGCINTITCRMYENYFLKYTNKIIFLHI